MISSVSGIHLRAIKHTVAAKEYISVLNGKGLAPLTRFNISGAANIIVPQKVIVSCEN